MTCSPGISPNGSPLQKSPLPDSSTPQPALGFLTISLHTIDHQPRGAITFAHNGCRKLRAYAYDSSCLTVSTFTLGGHPYSASNLQNARCRKLSAYSTTAATVFQPPIAAAPLPSQSQSFFSASRAASIAGSHRLQSIRLRPPSFHVW